MLDTKEKARVVVVVASAVRVVTLMIPCTALRSSPSPMKGAQLSIWLSHGSSCGVIAWIWSRICDWSAGSCWLATTISSPNTPATTRTAMKMASDRGILPASQMTRGRQMIARKPARATGSRIGCANRNPWMTMTAAASVMRKRRPGF